MSDDGSVLDLLRRAVVVTANVTYDLVAAIIPLAKGTNTASKGGDGTGSTNAGVSRLPSNGKASETSRSSGKSTTSSSAPGTRKVTVARKRREPATISWVSFVGRVRTISSQLFGNQRLFRGYEYSAASPGKRKTLVLDLDETLIHSTSRGSRNHDHVIEVLVDKHVCLYYIYKRPFVDFFLRKVSEWYNVVIFTASMPEYADPVIDYLDVTRTLISRRYFRQSCTQHNGTYIKDLAIIEPDLSKVLLIDNSPISYAINQDNGVPIEGWISDPLDESLLDLLPFLDSLRFVDDVRSVLSLRV